jgi:hypothetical protein
MSDELNNDSGQVDADELQAELEALRGKNKQLLDEAKAAKKTLRNYDGIDPEEYRALVEAQEKAEEERAKAAGEFDKIKAKYDSQVEKLQATLAEEQKRNQRTHVVAETNRAIAKHGGNPKLLEPVLMQTLRCDTDGETYTVYAEVDGAKVSATEFVASLKNDPDYEGAFPGAGTAGSGSRPSSTPGDAGFAWPEGIEIIS